MITYNPPLVTSVVHLKKYKNFVTERKLHVERAKKKIRPNETTFYISTVKL